MTTIISKISSDQLKYSDTLETATRQHGEALADKVTRLVWGAEAPPVSLVLVVRALLVLLQLASRALRTADARHAEELADDEPGRVERNAAVDALRALIGSVQSSVIGVYGPVYAGNVGLMGRLERRPDMLSRRAERIAQQLRAVPVPAPLLAGATVDVALVAGSIETAGARVEAAIASVTKEQSEADATLVARDQAADHWERVVQLVGNFMVGLAEVAGELAIAARIRPTTRRLRGELEGDDLDADVVVDPSTDEDTDPLVGDPTDPGA